MKKIILKIEKNKFWNFENEPGKKWTVPKNSWYKTAGININVISGGEGV